MNVKTFLIFFMKLSFIVANTSNYQQSEAKKIKTFPVTEITDEKWDQIQKGQWLVGFFDRETEESRQLDEYWQLFSMKCKEFNINVGRVFAPQNPGLYVRFLVTVFPKVFYIKNGVAHEIPKVSKEVVMELIKDQTWSKLKPVNFLSNPFSVQMSLLSHLFVHAVNLYNFENAIVQKFVSAPSATDVVFGLTFIIVGTFMGLLMTCAFGFLQIFFLDSKESEEKSDDKHSDNEEEEEEKREEESSEKSAEVRKRK